MITKTNKIINSCLFSSPTATEARERSTASRASIAYGHYNNNTNNTTTNHFTTSNVDTD